MAISEDDIAAALEAARADWIEALTAQIQAGAMAGLNLLGHELSEVISFDIFEPNAVEYAKTQAALKVTQILETTREQVKGVIAEAIEKGWSLDETAAALTAVYEDFESTRAITIARTEMSGAINWGKRESAKQTAADLGLQLDKEWSAVRDGRTRPTHSAVSGTKIKLDEKFSVGGYAAEGPYDPNLPAEEVICCRCLLTFSEAKPDTA